MASLKNILHFEEEGLTSELGALIGGGGECSYIHVLPNEFLFKLINLVNSTLDDRQDKGNRACTSGNFSWTKF